MDVDLMFCISRRSLRCVLAADSEAFEEVKQ